MPDYIAVTPQEFRRVVELKGVMDDGTNLDHAYGEVTDWAVRFALANPESFLTYIKEEGGEE